MAHSLLSRLLLAAAILPVAAGCSRKGGGDGASSSPAAAAVRQAATAAEAAAAPARQGDVRDGRYAEVMAELGRAYLLLGRHDLAGPVYEELVALDEGPGGDDARLAGALADLALVRKSQGRTREAEKLYERSLALTEQTFGPDHPETARALTNLAVLRFEAGEPGKARPLQERALASAERALGADHPRVASLRRNLDLMVAAGPSSSPKAGKGTTAVAAAGKPARAARARRTEVAAAEASADGAPFEGTRLLARRPAPASAANETPAQRPAATLGTIRVSQLTAPPAARPKATPAATPAARSPTSAPRALRHPSGSYAIHVTSLHDPAELPGEWRRLKGQYPSLSTLQLQRPQAVATDSGIVYPIVGGTFAAVASAEAACDLLREQGQGCRVVTR